MMQKKGVFLPGSACSPSRSLQSVGFSSARLLQCVTADSSQWLAALSRTHCPRQFCNRGLWWEPSHTQIHQLPRGWFSGKFQKAELQRAPSAGHQSDFCTMKGTIAMSSLTRPGGLFLGSMSAQKTVAAPHICCLLYFLRVLFISY